MRITVHLLFAIVGVVSTAFAQTPDDEIARLKDFLRPNLRPSPLLASLSCLSALSL
jgi:hypothetical protein